MTPARVRACSRLASRAIKLGASAAWRSNTLRFTTMIVSILGAGAWPDRRTGGPAVRTATAAAIASLLEQINALVQRIDLRSEEHTSELQSLAYLVCRLLLEKKKDGQPQLTH